jgi:DNA excision repair protein ERCC-4
MKRSGMVVAVDTREQRPYRFPRWERKALASGDYSVVGLEDRVAVERKTKADAYASLGRGRGRFEREVERLAKMDYAALVIEASLPEFLVPPAFSRLNPRSAVASLLAWSVRHRVFVFFAGDRQHGRAVTWSLLEKYWRYHMEKVA